MTEKLVEIKDLEISFGEGRKKFEAVKMQISSSTRGNFSLVGESGLVRLLLVELLSVLMIPVQAISSTKAKD